MSRFTAIPADVFAEAEDRYDTEVDLTDYRGSDTGKTPPRSKDHNASNREKQFQKAWKRIEDKFK